ncbi:MULTISPECIES: carboxymuconolactone decarboxylase family protein [Mycobacteriaceae]|uniref:Alkyl hydroperoxide reductase AhpD n=3 Tax=Mycobacteriaceae TaxID=1762 RepID=A0A9P3Q5U0_9MYCO|nr:MULTISPECIES: carboxymuconolactone decarboxylase family protein [Mycobacteriaceae]ATO68869.1 carboxymuconolactone decarboxylase family protein [Mycobacterium avium subsp. hominissuis]ATO71629.2 carboxymuconolactone decarboxylase family protein [Mycobacterium avium subsp. hominissuis]KQH75493.1 alkylhydroperoxidase [Mycobacterium gordonae]MCA2318532.1 carboxymuconolactone decarboxylase family protein [Mycobacterium intracellulare]MCA2339255.1 carboxymuconolactone decarboxylase family protein
MANFVPVEPEAATGRAAELLAQVHKSLGLTPNMTKVMASSPTLLQAYLALSGAVAGGVLSPAVRERLAIATAELNGCEYCLSAHTYIGANIAKLDSDELAKAREGDSKDAHVAALLKLSNTIAANAGDVDETEVKAAREAGATEEEIGEVVANLALNILTNYFNVLAHVDNDWPVVALNHHQN